MATIWQNQGNSFQQNAAMNSFNPGSFASNPNVPNPNNPLLFLMQNQGDSLNGQRQQLMMNLAGLGANGTPGLFNGMGNNLNGLMGKFGAQANLGQGLMNFNLGLQTPQTNFKNEETMRNLFGGFQQKLSIQTPSANGLKASPYMTPAEIVITPSQASDSSTSQMNGSISKSSGASRNGSVSSVKDISLLYQNISSYVNSVMKFKTKEIVRFYRFDADLNGKFEQKRTKKCSIRRYFHSL